jgi:hypothetical protein
MNQQDWVYSKNHVYEEDYNSRIVRHLFGCLRTYASRTTANPANTSGSTCATASSIAAVGI